MAGPILSLLAVAAYGGLHSLLATAWAKRRARHAAGPAADRYYRLLYNAIGLVTLLPVLAVPARFPGQTLYVLGMPWLLVAIGLQASAVVVLLVGLTQTDPWHFLGVRQLIKPSADHPGTLVIVGLYRWVRHPLYSAGLLFIWATPWMTTSILALNLGLTAYIYLGSQHEELRLRQAFPGAYRDYQATVPRLIPRPWRRYSSPS
jgi:methanethiol S-methyltransferase